MAVWVAHRGTFLVGGGECVQHWTFAESVGNLVQDVLNVKDATPTGNHSDPTSSTPHAAIMSDTPATTSNRPPEALSIAPAAAVALRGDEKRDVVRTMFDKIAPNYDRMNLVISVGQTTWWRKRAFKRVGFKSGDRVLDVGCGTGWAVQFLKKRVPGIEIEGMDLSPGMLVEARKIDPSSTYFEGDVCNIDRPDGHYDTVITVFTSRNFPDLEASVRDMLRVLRPGGKLMVLDSFPAKEGSLWGAFQAFWMGRVVPILVRPFADPQAYGYLAASIQNHVPADQLAEICRAEGASSVEVTPYSFGSATCVLATKGGSAA